MSLVIWLLNLSYHMNSLSKEMVMVMVEHARIYQYANGPNGPSRSHHQHLPWKLDRLSYSRAPTPYLWVNPRNISQTISPRCCESFLQPTVLSVGAQLSLFLESISHRLISKSYMQDLAMWLFLRYDQSSYHNRKLIPFIDLAKSLHA